MEQCKKMQVFRQKGVPVRSFRSNGFSRGSKNISIFGTDSKPALKSIKYRDPERKKWGKHKAKKISQIAENTAYRQEFEEEKCIFC